MQIHRFSRDRPAISAILGLLAVMSVAFPAPAQNVEPIGPKLTPKLQDLLQREMISILDASHRILDGLIMGDYAAVAEQARAIERSFIMEQSMTEEDRRDLMAVLPAEFVDLDRSFHETAANVAEAAQNNDPARAHAAFDQIIDRFTEGGRVDLFLPVKGLPSPG